MVSVLCLMTHLDAFLFFCEMTHLVVVFFLSSAVLPLCDSVSRQFLHCLNFVLSLLPFKDSLLVFDPSFIHENCNFGFNLSAACCLLFNILLIKAIRLGLLHLFICIQFPSPSCFQPLGAVSFQQHSWLARFPLKQMTGFSGCASYKPSLTGSCNIQDFVSAMSAHYDIST